MGLKPEEDLVSHLATQLSLTAGTDIFYRPVLPPDDYVAEKAVFVFPFGGPPPQAMLGETEAVRRSMIIVRVRGDQDDFDGALLFARQVRDEIRYADIANYIDWRLESTEPFYLGQDDERHPEFSITCEAMYEE